MLTRKHLPILFSALAILVLAALACGLPAPGSSPPATEAMQPPPAGTTVPVTEEAPPAGSDSGGAAGGAIDPCALLTQQDVEALWGVPSQPGAPSQVTIGTVTTHACRYISTDNANSLFVSVAWFEGGAANSIGWTSVTEGGQEVAINGAVAMYTGDLLYIAKGNWLASVNGLLGGSIATAEQLAPAAQIVADRLP